MISADQDPPVGRPNLSKDFLAGEAKDDWIPLWPQDLYGERRIELLLGSPVSSIDPAARTVRLENGTRREFGSLLIATGADPVRLSIPGRDTAKVHYLRSFSDSRAIVDLAGKGRHAVVVGGSFIGLEVAASLRTRGVAVDVVAKEQLPLERVMGPDVGRFIRSIHESHGVVFHLGQTVSSLTGRKVSLSGGSTLDADFVVIGVGVKPSMAVAEKAGIAIDSGIAVNEFLETSVPGIFAAGDVARFPVLALGDSRRVEHEDHANTHGKLVGANMAGAGQQYVHLPFFYSDLFELGYEAVGDVGEIHPGVSADFGIEPKTALFELNLSALLAVKKREFQFREVSREPSVRRDLAVLVDRAQPAGLDMRHQRGHAAEDHVDVSGDGIGERPQHGRSGCGASAVAIPGAGRIGERSGVPALRRGSDRPRKRMAGAASVAARGTLLAGQERFVAR